MIRKELSIPVYANGGICTLDDVTKCIRETGVCGVMVGEAILENPAFFVNGVDPTDGHLLTVVRVCSGVENRMRYATSTWTSRRSIMPFRERSKRICLRFCTERFALERRRSVTRRSSRRNAPSWH